MTARLSVLVASIAALGYLVLGFQRAWLAWDGTVRGALLASAIVAILVLTLGLVVRELIFGKSVSRLIKEFSLGDSSVGLDFETAKLLVESNPNDWRHWYQLAVCYDEAKDRTAARKALREAVKLHKLAS